jgi:plastocyanin
MNTYVRTSLVVAAALLTAAACAAADQTKVTVHINGFKFNPETITVKKGSEVTFVNEDSAPHTVTPAKGANFEGISRLLKTETGTIKFDTAGKQQYYCAIHPSMKGTVIVK